MILLVNPSNQSRLCAGLQENLEPYEARHVAPDEEDRVDACPGCWCDKFDLPAEPVTRVARKGKSE